MWVMVLRPKAINSMIPNEPSVLQSRCSVQRIQPDIKEQSDLEEERYVEFNYSSDGEVPTEDTVTDEATEPVLQRSGRERHRSDYYREKANIASNQLIEPTTVEEALASTDKDKWLDAVEKEMESLHGNDVWDLVELPKNRKAVGSKWVFKLKVGADGSVEQHKARLVAQGFSQKFGADYDETFFVQWSGLNHSEL